jgi:hypothetical protein
MKIKAHITKTERDADFLVFVCLFVCLFVFLKGKNDLAVLLRLGVARECSTKIGKLVTLNPVTKLVLAIKLVDLIEHLLPLLNRVVLVPRGHPESLERDILEDQRAVRDFNGASAHRAISDQRAVVAE